MKQQPAITAGRLDGAVKALFDLSNQRARGFIRTGKIFVDEARVLDPAHLIAPGQVIRLEMSAPRPGTYTPLGLELIYRDDHLIVVNKPAGLLSAPVGGHVALVSEPEEPSALLGAGRLCKGPRRPRVVHRLDKDTSGLLMFARTNQAARVLRRALDEHAVQRVYHCVVQGQPEQARGLISSMLIRDTGKGYRGSRKGSLRLRSFDAPDPGPMPGHGQLAITRYQRVAVEGDRAALEVRLSTGRTHQIRIHLSELGCPVVGDRVYGSAPSRFEGPRHALHAARLILSHPATGEQLILNAPWPEDLAGLSPLGKDWGAR
ncbi:RluA family pseudouridine synthase [Myxococcota bacterium]|nr:RluA family pseudouridine synthase [Myxococcota bacterium]MBU1430381.1 RluA family pseudouridine synthase [Myxococcota bacterium]MBU1900640.1 RluA family pseudouridine synthase [Myxococcota bacterium]